MSNFNEIIAHSPKMQEVVKMAKKFAALDMPLLIQGETGTGKELLAKACHHAGPRANKQFIAINCAGLPKEDAETEMFGHKGGNGESIGFFEYVSGGTVLLDSISELPLELQAKLLRFLNDGTFRRVGEEKEHYANVRVICTSQVPLFQDVEQGKMRSDLYHRLNALTLDLPPLRERKEDIEGLTQLFIQQISHILDKSEPSVNRSFIQFLQNHDWRGNVRELYNVLYRACSLNENNQLSIEQLTLTHNRPLLEESLTTFENLNLEQIMNQYEERVLRQFYTEYPSTRKLAQRLGVSHTAIANKLRQYGIHK